MLGLLLGCVGAVDLGRATVLAPGDVELVAGGGGLARGDVPATSTDTGAYGAAVGLRGGVAPRLELGATVGTVGMTGGNVVHGGVDAKVALTAPGASTHVAVDPRFAGGSLSLTGAPLYVADLPLLFGWDVGRSQAIVSPHVAAVFGRKPDGAPVAAYGAVGQRAGWALSLGGVDLLPAVEVSWTRGLSAGSADATGLVLVGGGVTVAVPLQ